MHTIQVLGPGCRRCEQLLERTREAARELGIEEAAVEKVTEIEALMRHGILSTPALVVDGTVRVSGRVPSVAELREMLQ